MPMAMMAALADVISRLNREDQNQTKLDSQFSKWKFLIGPHDWEDHSAGKEGVSRYRGENLPKVSKPGLYELAIYCPGSSSRDHPGKVDPSKVVVVYLGEADNVRTRLQQYGRSGSHLCGSDSGEKLCGNFDDIFKRGCSIVYRWLPMENKADARKMEAELLRTSDYAWNRGSNGARRHDDILQKLDKRALNRNKHLNLSTKHLHFLRKQVGIKIQASKLVLQDNEFSKFAEGEIYNSLWQVFKFNRSLPRLVLDRGSSDENDTITCGVVLEDGSICGRPPAKGRKRCAEHKGKKGSAVRLSTSEKSQPHKAWWEYVLDNGEFNVPVAKIPSLRLVPSLAGNFPKIEQCSPICGVVMDDGSRCRRQPVSGRKRCDLHKGRRICSSNSGTRCPTVPYTDKKSSEIVLPGKLEAGVSPRRPVFNEGLDTICGVEFGNGYICTSQPAKGRIRCEDHKGMQVTSLLSGLDARSTDSRSDSRNRNHGSNSSRSSINGGTACNGSFCPRTVMGNARSSSICGAPTLNGTPCQNTVKGNGRCYLHSNNGGNSTSRLDYCISPNSNYGGGSSSICGAPTLNGAPCQNTVKGNGRCYLHLDNGGSSTSRPGYCTSQYSTYGGGSSSICGAPTSDGAPCQRTVKGSGRCWQHSNNGGSSTSHLGYFSSPYSNYGGGSSSICGAPTRNGSFCQRTVRGNGRCWQH